MGLMHAKGNLILIPHYQLATCYVAQAEPCEGRPLTDRELIRERIHTANTNHEENHEPIMYHHGTTAPRITR
jgi:hypothetical protein